MKSIFKFLRLIRDNNNREWFAANKSIYLSAQAKANNFAESLIAAVATIDAAAGNLTVKDCTYRIYRDTRFSADKTPYKTHIGIFINPPFGKKTNSAGYYVHLEPDNCFICAGTVCLETPIIKAIRKSIFDNISDYRDIVENPEFRSLFTSIGDNLLKTAPKGFDKNWEYIDYLRPKDFIAIGHVNDNFFFDESSLIDRIMPYLKQAKRFNDFLNFTIDDFIIPDNEKEELPYIY